MTLTAYPCKLSPEEFEARLSGSYLPLPGQVLRLVAPAGAYVQVVSIQTVSVGEGLVCCRILQGRPSLAPVQVEVLTPALLRQAIQALQPEVNHPLHLGRLGTFDFFRLGALNVISGDAFSNQYDALTLFMDGITRYQNVLVLDPLGLATPGENSVCLHAGDDFRLSLQDVGSKQFLDNFAQLLPQSLQEAGLRTLANLLPTSMQAFVGFQSLFALESLAEAPLRNLILQNLHMMAQSHIFADTPEDVFSLESPLPQRITILDVSVLTEPWKCLFYAELCRHVIRTAGGDTVLALIHPEHYLNDLPAWFRQADEAELTILALPSSHRQVGMEGKDGFAASEKSNYANASNHLKAETNGHLLLQGQLTWGLPLQATLCDDALEATEFLTESLPFSAPAAFLTEGESESDFFAEPSSVSQVTAEQTTLIMASEPEVVSQQLESKAPFIESFSEGDLSAHAIENSTASFAVENEPPVMDLDSKEEAETTLFPDTMNSDSDNGQSDDPQVLEPANPNADSVLEADEALAFRKPEEAGTEETEIAQNEIEQAEEPGLFGESDGEDSAEPFLPEMLEMPEIEDAVEPVRIFEEEETEEEQGEAQETGEEPGTTAENEDDDEGEDWFPDFDASLISGLPGETSITGLLSPLSEPSSETDAFLEDGDDDLFFAFDPDLGDEHLSSENKGLDTLGTAVSPVESMGTVQSPPMPEELQYENEEEAEPATTVVDSVPAPPFVDETPPIYQHETHLPPQSLPQSPFQAGERVHHPTYGAGTVMKVLPMAEQVILNISFEQVGKRLLDPSLCELTREGETPQ